MKNLKKILPFLTLVLIQPLYAQTNFNAGYANGYKVGFCYNKSNCITPIPPLAPMPRINEDMESYKDGYNRGFNDGLKNQTGSEDRKRYTTSKPEFIDFSSNSTSSTNAMLLKALMKKKETEQKVQQYFDDVYSEISSFNDKDSEEIRFQKSQHLEKLEILAEESTEYLRQTRGNYQGLVDKIEKIQNDFYDRVNSVK